MKIYSPASPSLKKKSPDSRRHIMDSRKNSIFNPQASYDRIFVTTRGFIQPEWAIRLCGTGTIKKLGNMLGAKYCDGHKIKPATPIV